MRERKSYRQFCGLARSLDRVGDRRTLLIVRELLLGDRTFRDLQTALNGISPSLLTKRLSELADDGLVVRNKTPRRSKSVEYRLTDGGRSLEPVIIERIRWAAGGCCTARVTIRSTQGGHRWRCGRCWRADHLVGAASTSMSTGSRLRSQAQLGRRVTPGHEGRPHATVAAPFPVMLTIAADAMTLQSSGARLAGDGGIASELLSARGGPS